MTHFSAQRGMATAAIVTIVALVLIGAGAAYYFATQSPVNTVEEIDDVMIKDDEAMMEKEAGGETMVKEDDEAMMQKDETSMVKYSGAVLAGTASPLLDFNKADYDAAVKSDKVVALYFFANWCPICAAEFPKMQAAFNELSTDQVVGFRVNYNDNETDADEKALARQYGVAYQHTKVFLKGGQQILKSPESWSQERYTTEINNAIAQ